MTRRPRGLRPDERELWSRVAATAEPMHRKRVPLEPEPGAEPPAAHHPKTRVDPPPKSFAPVAAFRPAGPEAEPRIRLDLAPGPGEWLAHAPVRMDRKAHQKMTRGKIEPEARIDLHGMTLSEAHPELIRFILNAHAAGRRLLLVITGKGKPGSDDGPIPQRRGVLRHQVPHWLAQPPLGAAVLQVSQAHLKHGGGGAYYVYLRRHG